MTTEEGKAAAPEADTMEDVERDIEEVFRYDRDERPQDRAHAYIDKNRVQRGFSDTAMLCAALHMARRAHAIGRVEAMRSDGGLARKAALLTRMSGELLELAVDMRGASRIE